MLVSIISKRTRKKFRKNIRFIVRFSKLSMATFTEIAKMHIFVVVIIMTHAEFNFYKATKKMFHKESKSTK